MKAGLNRQSPLLDNAVRVSQDILTKRAELLEVQGPASELYRTEHAHSEAVSQVPEDPALVAMVELLASRLDGPPRMRADRVAHSLSELAQAQLDAVGDSLFEGAAALGRIEKNIAYLKSAKLNGVYLKMDELVPPEHLAALRERWYPRAKDYITKQLIGAVEDGIDARVLRPLATLADVGDEVISKEAGEALAPMLFRALLGNDRGVRSVAADLLQRFPPTESQKQVDLIRLIRSGHFDEAELSHLAKSVSTMTPQGPACQELLLLLNRDRGYEKVAQNPAVRAAAIRALARGIGQSDAYRAEPLIIAALDDPNIAVQKAAVQAIGEARLVGARDQIIALARSEQNPPIDPELKAAAIRTLVRIPPPVPRRQPHYRRKEEMRQYDLRRSALQRDLDIFTTAAGKGGAKDTPLEVRRAGVYAVAHHVGHEHPSSAAQYYLLPLLGDREIALDVLDGVRHLFAKNYQRPHHEPLNMLRDASKKAARREDFELQLQILGVLAVVRPEFTSQALNIVVGETLLPALHSPDADVRAASLHAMEARLGDMAGRWAPGDREVDTFLDMLGEALPARGESAEVEQAFAAALSLVKETFGESHGQAIDALIKVFNRRSSHAKVGLDG